MILLTSKWLIESLSLKAKIVKDKSLKEYPTSERCFVAENYCNELVSIARARVEPGETTVTHHLKGVTEIYLISHGKGKVKVGNLPPTEVTAGDLVVIPAGVSQKITNTGKTNLIFHCICTPRFTPDRYFNEEEK